MLVIRLSSSVNSTSCFSWRQDKKELSLKVDSDGYVDKTAGVGDPAIEGQSQLARLHHHGGRGVREGTFGCFCQRLLKTINGTGFLYKRSELYLGGVEILRRWCNFQSVPAQVHHLDCHDQVASKWSTSDSLIVTVHCNNLFYLSYANAGWSWRASAQCPKLKRFLINKTQCPRTYAKDWLDQLFFFPGLVWKEVYLGCDHSGIFNINHFPVY